MTSFYKTADSFKQGSTTLPQKYYIEDLFLKQEMENIFFKTWLCIGRSNEINKSGEYKIITIGYESLFIIRNEDKKLKAFYNICRHRGTRICNKENGKYSKSIQCPYHGWTYDLSGRLIGAPNMDAVEQFNKDNYPLFPADLIEWEGFIFINLSENPSEFKLEYKPIINRFSEWEINDIEIYESKVYLVNCNWKLIIQNYSECYHCPIIHKSLADITSYLGGRNDLVSGPFLGGYMEMNSESITMDGKLCGPIFKNLSKKNIKRVYYYALFPNLLLSLHPDYVMFHTVWPDGPQKCKINCNWLFTKEAIINSDYQPSKAIDFWHKTNLEDWDICEQSQLGIQSNKYSPGPYSGQESLLSAYDNYYLSMLKKVRKEPDFIR